MGAARRRHPPGNTARARAWDFIRKLGEFTLAEVMIGARIEEDNARILVDQLEAGGFVLRSDVPEGRFQPIRWRVVKDPGAAFLNGEGGLRSPRARLWQSMRIRRSFRVGDLVATTGVSLYNADKFVRLLLRAGYLSVQSEKDNGRPGGAAVYCLTKNTGPEPPVISQDGSVFDPNLKITTAQVKPASEGRRTRRDRAWAAIRSRTTFTVADIQDAAKMSEDGVRRYLAALARAGFIHGAKIPAAGAPGFRVEYRLVVDPGPLTPRLLPDGRVFNPNDRLIWGASE